MGLRDVYEHGWGLGLRYAGRLIDYDCGKGWWRLKADRRGCHAVAEGRLHGSGEEVDLMLFPGGRLSKPCSYLFVQVHRTRQSQGVRRIVRTIEKPRISD